MGILEQVIYGGRSLRQTLREAGWGPGRRWAKMWAGLSLASARAHWSVNGSTGLFCQRQEAWASASLGLSVTGGCPVCMCAHVYLHVGQPLGISCTFPETGAVVSCQQPTLTEAGRRGHPAGLGDLGRAQTAPEAITGLV